MSGANFFGETMEWWGFAIACWTLPALVFAVMTTVMIGTRALTHHRYYNYIYVMAILICVGVGII